MDHWNKPKTKHGVLAAVLNKNGFDWKIWLWPFDQKLVQRRSYMVELSIHHVDIWPTYFKCPTRNPLVPWIVKSSCEPIIHVWANLQVWPIKFKLFKIMTAVSRTANLKAQIWYLFTHGEYFEAQRALTHNYSNISLIIISVNPTLTDGTSEHPSKFIARKLRVIMI